jgi:hypothetical protein
MLRYNNINVRVLALLYIRIAVDYNDIFACINASFADNKSIPGNYTIG